MAWSGCPARAAPATGVGELQMPITLDVDEVVPLHPGHRLRHRRTTLMQPLGDPRAEGNDALLLELIDRPQVHLRGIDQVAHEARLDDALRRDPDLNPVQFAGEQFVEDNAE